MFSSNGGLQVQDGLDSDKVKAFLQRENPAVLALLQEMERRETWVLREGEAETVVQGLGQVIPAFIQQHFVEGIRDPERASLLAVLVGYVGAVQFVAFLMQSETVRSGIIQQVLFALRDSAGSDSAVFESLFLERIQLVLQSDLKQRIFAPARVNEVVAIVKMIESVRERDA